MSSRGQVSGRGDDVAATSDRMVDFYVEPWEESTGRVTWCVRRYLYEPDHFSREVVSWHETRQEAQEERDRLAAA